MHAACAMHKRHTHVQTECPIMQCKGCIRLSACWSYCVSRQSPLSRRDVHIPQPCHGTTTLPASTTASHTARDCPTGQTMTESQRLGQTRTSLVAGSAAVPLTRSFWGLTPLACHHGLSCAILPTLNPTRAAATPPPECSPYMACNRNWDNCQLNQPCLKCRNGMLWPPRTGAVHLPGKPNQQRLAVYYPDQPQPLLHVHH